MSRDSICGWNIARSGDPGSRCRSPGSGATTSGCGSIRSGRSAVVAAALDAGITFFDTARIYGGGKSEELPREGAGCATALRCCVATKFGLGSGPDDLGGSRRHIMRSVETSLRELGTDWIDLFQLHFPDAVTPIEETLDALSDLVHQGKVRYLGCSNFTGWMIADAHWTSETRRLESFVSAQNEWSLLNRKVEHEVVPACQRFGFGVIPYFPLASGLLTGKVQRGEKPARGKSARGRPLRARPARRQLRQARPPRAVGQGARSHAHRGRALVVGESAGGLVGDRGRDVTRAGDDQRGRDANGSHAGGDHGDRRTRRALTARRSVVDGDEGLVRGRQVDPDHRPAARGLLDVDGPTVLGNDLADDGEPEPRAGHGARAVGPVEAVEDAARSSSAMPGPWSRTVISPPCTSTSIGESRGLNFDALSSRFETARSRSEGAPRTMAGRRRRARTSASSAARRARRRPG